MKSRRLWVGLVLLMLVSVALALSPPIPGNPNGTGKPYTLVHPPGGGGIDWQFNVYNGPPPFPFQ